MIDAENIFKPNPGPQEKFLALPDEILEALYGGALGGGKSWVILMLPIVQGRYKHPRFSGIIFRRTYPQLEEYLIKESKEIYPKLGAIYNETKHVWNFPNGGRLKFDVIECMGDAREHDGHEYDYIGFDELQHFDEAEYTYMISRLRSTSKDLPPIIRSTANPGNRGHAWVRARFIELERNGYKKIWCNDTKSYRIFIPSKVSDNPKLLEKNPNYINQLMALPESERKAKMDGDWWAFSGQVFTEFRIIPNFGEPKIAQHVIEPFEIPSFWPKILSMDWGYTHKFAAHWHAISPDSRVYTYREYIRTKTNIDTIGAEVGQLSRLDQNLVLSVMDPSCWKTESHGRTIAGQFEDASGLILEKAINDRIAGKLHFHSMLRWQQKPARFIPDEGYNYHTYDRILRMYGKDRAKEYADMFIPESPETNLPRWQIFNVCKDLINTIPLLVYDESHTEDVSKFDGDDSYDETRYGLMGVKTYMESCAKEFKALQERQMAVNEVMVTGDQTKYYRKMEAIERGSVSRIVPFNRFQSRRNAIKRSAHQPFARGN